MEVEELEQYFKVKILKKGGSVAASWQNPFGIKCKTLDRAIEFALLDAFEQGAFVDEIIEKIRKENLWIRPMDKKYPQELQVFLCAKRYKKKFVVKKISNKWFVSLIQDKD